MDSGRLAVCPLYLSLVSHPMTPPHDHNVGHQYDQKSIRT